MARILLLNKPFNVLCQFTDKEGRATLADYINDSGVYPAGRLDYDSEGLVVLTDDGRLQHLISNPSAKCSKTYWLQVEGTPKDADLEPLRQGVKLNDGPCRPAKVKLIQPPSLWPRTPPIRERSNSATHWLEITISEGRNRQLRRMTASIGFPTLRLIRISVGEWSIAAIATGQSQLITLHAPREPSPHRRQTPRTRPNAKATTKSTTKRGRRL